MLDRRHCSFALTFDFVCGACVHGLHHRRRKLCVRDVPKLVRALRFELREIDRRASFANDAPSHHHDPFRVGTAKLEAARRHEQGRRKIIEPDLRFLSLELSTPALKAAPGFVVLPSFVIAFSACLDQPLGLLRRNLDLADDLFGIVEKRKLRRLHWRHASRTSPRIASKYFRRRSPTGKRSATIFVSVNQ